MEQKLNMLSESQSLEDLASVGAISPNGNTVSCSNGRFGVRDVWKYNIHEEFHVFRNCVQLFTYVLMDTKYPGKVARPIGEFRSSEEFLYQQLRCNVNLLEVIQLVFAFLDDNGKLPSGVPRWQFNFKFDLTEYMYEEVTIKKLEAAGIDFSKHKEDGIDRLEFAALLFSSGIVLTENIKWISFHKGLDFGYLVKLLTAMDLPEDETEFSELLKTYFPVICNISNLSSTDEDQEICLNMFKEQLKLQSER